MHISFLEKNTLIQERMNDQLWICWKRRRNRMRNHTSQTLLFLQVSNVSCFFNGWLLYPFHGLVNYPGHYYADKIKRKEPRYLDKFFTGLASRAFQQKQWHNQHSLLSIHSLVPAPCCFLSICEWETICVAVQQIRLGSDAGHNPAKDCFFPPSVFRVIGSWVSSMTCCIMQSHKQLSSAQTRGGTERKSE